MERIVVAAKAGADEPWLADAAANLAEHCIKKVEVVEYEDLGMEAVWKIDVEDFPAFIIIDDKGNDFFAAK